MAKAKHSKQYKQMCKKYKKSLMKLAKNASEDPFDYGVALEFFVEHMRYMRDYYKLGENVWAMEMRDAYPESYANVPSRYESLRDAVAQYDVWDNELWTNHEVAMKAKEMFFKIIAENIEGWWD